MRYSVIDLNSCEKHTFYDCMILNTTDNPIISYIGNGYYNSGLNSISLSNGNAMKPYYSSDHTSDGITIHPNGDGSYHIYGTSTTDENNFRLYTRQNLLNKYSRIGLTIEVTNDSGINTPVFYTNDTVIPAGTTEFKGNFQSFSYINFKTVRGESYDFEVKAWSFLYETSDRSYHQYADPVTINSPVYVLYYNGVGYNFLIPKKFLNMSVIITAYNTAPTSSYLNYELYYNPDYEFDYRTITEDMDRFDIPTYVRPFTGTISAKGVNALLPEYPVKGIRWFDWSSTATNVVGNICCVDYKFANTTIFDKQFNYGSSYLSYLYPNSTYSSSSYNIYNFGGATVPDSNTRHYEWILGDPPLELATD